MALVFWFQEHWFDLFQTVGIIGSLLFTGYTTQKDERARRIGNSIAINEQYREIWKELYVRPELSRVLSDHVELDKQPVSAEEELFVHMLILHLGTVYRAIKEGMFVKLEGLQKDVGEFFALPIPKAVWKKAKPLQDRDFVEFIESV